MEIKETLKLKRNRTRFLCKKCDFKCYMKCDWDRHILTLKHQKETVETVLETDSVTKTYFCECGQKYMSKSGLWKHGKICEVTNKIESGEEAEDEPS